MAISSAQPWGQKRTTLTQELIRRLLNCSKELSCEVRRRHLNNYMQLLKNSGYCEKFRAEVLRSGLQGYSKIVAAEKKGRRPVYRPKDWQNSARWLAKKKKKRGLAWKILEVLYLHSTNTRIQTEEIDAKEGGRDEKGRKGKLAH